MAINEAKLEAFVGRFVGDLGAVMHASTVMGDQLGLYQAMGDSEPVTAGRLAERTGLDERWLREWLSVGLALGAQAGEARLTETLNEAGFSSVRRAAETPFNIVLEARP